MDAKSVCWTEKEDQFIIDSYLKGCTKDYIQNTLLNNKTNPSKVSRMKYSTTNRMKKLHKIGRLGTEEFKEPWYDIEDTFIINSFISGKNIDDIISTISDPFTNPYGINRLRQNIINRIKYLNSHGKLDTTRTHIS